MTVLSLRPNVAVIGAGAAGIAAGRELRWLGFAPLLLEARDRLGGRAWTVPHGAGAPLDLGCEWLHSADRNLLVGLAERQGFAINRSEPPWARPSWPGGEGSCDAGREAAASTFDTFDERMARAADEARRTGCDRSAAEVLDPRSPWNGLIGAISTYYNGAPPARVSVLDYDAYCETGVNWRVVGGYGALLASLGRDLPIRFGCAVRRVDATGRHVRVETARGTVEAAGAVVTVPTNVIASGAIAFDPSLDDRCHAAAHLPLGIADKLYLALPDAEAYPIDTRVAAPGDRMDVGSYTLRPNGRPMIEGYYGGDYARALEDGGLPAFLDAARRELAGVFGGAAAGLQPIVATAWARDPHALGSYSHALPGHAGARAVLAEPAERIVFAGEAASPHFFSTAHGAYETGLAAARSLAAYIGRLPAAADEGSP